MLIFNASFDRVSFASNESINQLRWLSRKRCLPPRMPVKLGLPDSHSGRTKSTPATHPLASTHAPLLPGPGLVIVAVVKHLNQTP